MGRRRAVVEYGWVVSRNIGYDRSVVVYLNEQPPWHQGDLHKAKVYKDENEAKSYAYWHIGMTHFVRVTNGRIELMGSGLL